MTISLSGMHVVVDDVDEALTFYRDTLGMTVRNDVGNGTQRWVTLATDTQPELGIVLSPPHAGRSQEDGDAIAALLAKGALGMVQLRSDDLDAMFDKIASAGGVEVLSEPVTQPWGVRDAAVRDPAGNMVRIDQA
jgi:catechol 2,3-dioxygenase-like lactoylglutathione lyase family enzyme